MKNNAIISYRIALSSLSYHMQNDSIFYYPQPLYQYQSVFKYRELLDLGMK